MPNKPPVTNVGTVEGVLGSLNMAPFGTTSTQNSGSMCPNGTRRSTNYNSEFYTGKPCK